MFFIALLQLLVVILILRYLLRRKTGNPFSKKEITKFLGFGMLSLIIALLVPSLLLPIRSDMFFGMNPILSGFLTAFLTAALTEELAKYLCFRIAMFRDKEVVNWHDVILACIMIGIGFTIAEDIEFSLVGGANILRAFVPAHVLFQAIMGYFFGRACVKKSAADHILALAAPISAHTLFDMFLIAAMSMVNGDPANLSNGFLETSPYKGYLTPIAIGCVTVIVLTILSLLVFLYKIGAWGKKGEKTELIK